MGRQLQEHGLDAVKKALRLIAEDEKYRQIGEQNKKRQIPAADHHKIKFNPETVGLISLWSSRSSSKGFDEWELRQATLRPMQTPAPLPEEEPSSDSATTPEGFVVKQVVVGKASAGPGANAAPSSESKNKKGRRVAFRKRLRIPLNRDLTDLDPLEWALLGPESQRSEEDIATAALSVGSDVRFHWGSKQPVVISRRPQVNNVRVRVKPAAKKPRASRVVDDSESEEDREWDPTSLVINDDDDDDDDDDHDDNDGNSESFGIHGDDEESVGSDENDGVANPALMSSDWDTLLQTSRAASGGATAMLDSLASVAVRTLAKLPPSLRSQLPQPWTSSDKQGAESQQSSRLGVLADVASSSASEDDDAPLPQRAAKRKPAAPAPISSHSIFSRSPRSAAPANGSASLSRPKKTKSLNVPKQSGKEKPMGKKRKSSEHAMKSPQVPGPRVRRKIASKKLNVSQ